MPIREAREGCRRDRKRGNDEPGKVNGRAPGDESLARLSYRKADGPGSASVRNQLKRCAGGFLAAGVPALRAVVFAVAATTGGQIRLAVGEGQGRDQREAEPDQQACGQRASHCNEYSRTIHRKTD